MIAGDEERAVTRRQACEGCGVAREILHRSVDQIARDRDHVGLQRVDRIDDRVDVAPLDRRANVHVADLRDGEAAQ